MKSIEKTKSLCEKTHNQNQHQKHHPDAPIKLNANARNRKHLNEFMAFHLKMQIVYYETTDE